MNAERQFGATGREASAVRTVLLAVLSPTGNTTGLRSGQGEGLEAEASLGATRLLVSVHCGGATAPSRVHHAGPARSRWRANSRSVMSPL